MENFLVNLVNALSYGMLLFLLASGLTIIMGLMGITNLAHGAIYVLGAFVGWTILIQLGLNFGLAIVGAGLAAGVVGFIINRVLLQQLYKQPNEQVLMTIGFVYILTNITQWIWGPIPKSGVVPAILAGSVSIMGVTIPIFRLTIIG